MPIFEWARFTIALRTRVERAESTFGGNFSCSRSIGNVCVKDREMFPATVGDCAFFPFRAFFHRMIGRQTTKTEVLRFQELYPVWIREASRGLAGI